MTDLFTELWTLLTNPTYGLILLATLIALRVFIGLLLWDNAKESETPNPTIWLIFGIILPIVAMLLYYVSGRDVVKGQKFCVWGQPCRKKFKEGE